jgi:hypothetical protein
MSKLRPFDHRTNETINNLPDTTNKNFRDLRSISMGKSKERPVHIDFGGSVLAYSIWTHRAKKKKSKPQKEEAAA